MRGIDDPSLPEGRANHQTRCVPVALHLFGRDDHDINGRFRLVEVPVNLLGEAPPSNFPPLMTRRSRSLFGPISPRAADPNRTILSGWATSTTRRITSARTFGSGRPFLRPRRSVLALHVPLSNQVLHLRHRGISNRSPMVGKPIFTSIGR